MARKRPTVLAVMGILNIVLGSLFLLCNLCNGISYIFLIGGAGDQLLKGKEFAELTELWKFLRDQVPGYTAVEASKAIVGLIASTILILGGIGLLGVRRWGRTLSILYSIVAIVVSIGSLAYTLAIVNPALERFVQAHARGAAQPGMNNAVNSITAVVAAIISVAYAVVLLIMMLVPSVSAAFSAPAQEQDYELERQEEEDEYLERERRKREEEQE
jgi:hypothetical protein